MTVQLKQNFDEQMASLKEREFEKSREEMESKLIEKTKEYESAMAGQEKERDERERILNSLKAETERLALEKEELEQIAESQRIEKEAMQKA